MATLNSELSKINNRRDSVVEQEEKGLTVPVEGGEKKERKVSRFKVSVVTEPDLNKLTVPEKRNEEEKVVSVINEAYKSLEKVVESCYSMKPGELCRLSVFIMCCILFFIELVVPGQASPKTVMYCFIFAFLFLLMVVVVVVLFCFACLFYLLFFFIILTASLGASDFFW